jgi:prepilin-type N-terminal cleavage/methylation domain-containing protein
MITTAIREHSNHSHTQKAFTLIEMLVVVGIIVVVTGAVLANSGQLGGQFILQNFAYDMALSIRQAQTYGIAVRKFDSHFNYPYGMHFDASDNTHYILFADVNPNGVFDANNPSSELYQQYEITRGFQIQSLCATPSAGGSGEVCGLSRLDIIFKRPEPDAWISISDVQHCIPKSGDYCQASARIRLVAPRGDVKDVIVPANGQISVQ